MPKHFCYSCGYTRETGWIYTRTCPKCKAKNSVHYSSVKRDVAFTRRNRELLNESIELEEL